MNVYVYQAALLCESCGSAKQAQLDRVAADHGNPHHAYREDSGRYPQGPYPDGGGEADTPQHCDQCSAFLENPLTADGVAYTRDAIAEYIRGGRMDHGNRTGDHGAAYEWQSYYGRVLLGLDDAP